MDDMLLYWVWLSHVLPPDTTAFADLIAELDTPRAIFEAEDERIAEIIPRAKAAREAIARHDLEAARTTLAFCQSRGVGLLTYSDPRYPEAIRSIHTPPPLFYYRGQLPDFQNGFFVSVVGTRRMSDYGRKSAFSVARDLSLAGATLVSGMALGIDGVALAAAAAQGRPTVTVLGCGIDICYPKEHLTLARELVKCGCIMTELPPSTPPSRFTFPKRNRLIAGLSCATVVIEGKNKSGSLITARHALAEGRTVYALPGNVDQQNSEATNLLIKNGARLLLAADDVIRDFEFTYPGLINPFLLNDPPMLDMDAVLRRLRVVGERSLPFRRSDRRFSEEKNDREEREEPTVSEDALARRLEGVPYLAREVFSRIPKDGAVSTDSLVYGEITVRDVMKALLQLEVGGLITMLPGERVQRSV